MNLISRKEFYGKSGIYCIKSLIDTRIYIGSGVNVYRRNTSHREELRKNIHCNQKLQNFVNKYGIDKLKFEVIEFCLKEDVVDREQHYIDLHNSIEDGFNITFKAYSNLGRSFSKESVNKGIQTRKNNLILLSDEEYKLRKQKEFINKSVAKKGIKQKEEHIKARVFSRRINNKGKLKEDDVIKIIELLKNNIPTSIIAKEFNTNSNTISAIKFKRIWKDISRPTFTVSKGTNRLGSKLKDNDIVSIRYYFKHHKKTILELSEMYNVTIYCIKSIINRITWKHIGDVAELGIF